MCQNKSAKIYSENVITVCDAVYFRLCIHLMHILQPATAEGFDGSNHPSFSKWTILLVPRSRSSVKVKIKYQGQSFRKCSLCWDISVSQTQPAMVKVYPIQIKKPHTHTHTHTHIFDCNLSAF